MKSLKERLAAEEQDEDLIELRDKVTSLVKMSRSKMSKSYEAWDKHQELYRGYQPPDSDDIDAQEHGEPEKLVVPMSFAQIQTFVAFCFMLFTQNRRFFEFVATGSEDDAAVADAEEILDRDLRRNFWPSKLYQLLLDTTRFGLGIVKHWWAVEKQWAPVSIEPSTISTEGFAFQMEGGVEMREFNKFEGNRLANISPYNFFPDTRFPMSEWHKGTFVADETEWHINQLKQWERDGDAFGVEYIEDMSRDDFRKRGTTRLNSFSNYMDKRKADKDEQIICVTSCQMRLVPSKYKLGPEDYPVMYVITIANDGRVLNAKPMGYMHDEWTYDVAQFSPDMHQRISESLADIVFAMQDVISYLINSRLASVRKSLENNLVIDPSGVDMATVESRSPYILMKKGSPRLGVEKFVRQLPYVDTTSRHLEDAQLIMQIMQVVTGVNENAMGQFSGGRRSATEARAANSGSSSRMKVPATLIFADCLQPLGHKMLTNHRQGISQETFSKILGDSPEVLARYSLFKPQDVSKLVGVEDHFVFDGTLQSEKGFIAQSLQELVSAILSNPLVMQSLPLDVGKLMEKILQLRGIDNIEQFRLQPMLPQQQMMNEQIMQSGLAGGPPGAPQGAGGIPQV